MKTFDTYKEIAEELLNFGNRLLKLKTSFGFSDEDARETAITNSRIAFNNSLMILNILNVRAEDRCSDDDFRKLLGLASGSTQHAADFIEKMQRLSLVVFYQFQIENMLSNLHRELPSGSSKSTFYGLAEYFVGKLGIQTNKLDYLNVPALIRNSLHSNGIHHGYQGQSKSVTIGNLVYDFKHTEKVSCAGWNHIVVALSASIDCVEEILKLPEVASLQDPVMDHYTWELATQP